MKNIFTRLLLSTFVLLTLVSCGTGGLEGTFIPKNDAAKQNYFAKFEFQPEEEFSFLGSVFKKNTVKIYMGVMGIAMPVAYEMRYSLKGDRLIIEGGIPGVDGGSVEFNYNKEKNEISMNVDYAFDMLGAMFGGSSGQIGSQTISNDLKEKITPKWGKVGTFDPNNPNQENDNGGNSGNGQGGNNTGNGNSGNNMPTAHFDQKLAETCALYSALAYETTRIRTKSDILIKPIPNISPDGYDPYPNGYSPYKGEPYWLLNYKTLKDNGEIIYFTGKHDDSYVNDGNKYKPLVLNEQLKYDGYKEIVSRNYHDKIEDNISYTFAYKKDNANNVLLFVILRGTDHFEWYGNMEIGKNSESRHYSFELANKTLQDSIKNYIQDNELKNIIFVITGHSRGAAVANLLAGDLNEKNIDGVQRIVAYTFATPNSTKYPKEYNNIFNFCFEDDFVPQVPLDKRFSGWGYGKNGITYKAVAKGLYAFKSDFIENEEEYIQFSNGRKPNFNYNAVQDVLKEFHNKVPSVKDYYNPNLNLILLEVQGTTASQYISMHDFMRNYIAKAKINLLSTGTLGIVNNLSLNSDFHGIASFFFIGSVFQPYINDTHQAFTYYHALTSNGFLTKK